MSIFPDVVDNAARLHRVLDRGISIINDEEHSSKPSDKYIRVSSIGKCLRATYFNIVKGRPEIPPDKLMKFAVGTAVHELYQRVLQRTGRLFGSSVCLSCGAVTELGWLSAKGKCPDCGGLSKYEEIPMINSTLRTTGHPDGFVSLSKKRGKAILIEIKTITPYYRVDKGMSQVLKYVPEHINQANFYVGMLRHPDTVGEFTDVDLSALLPVLDMDSFLLVYHDKGTDKQTIFSCSFDKRMFSQDCRHVRKLLRALKTRKPPETLGHRLCRYCDFVNECQGLL